MRSRELGVKKACEGLCSSRRGARRDQTVVGLQAGCYSEHVNELVESPFFFRPRWVAARGEAVKTGRLASGGAVQREVLERVRRDLESSELVCGIGLRSSREACDGGFIRGLVSWIVNGRSSNLLASSRTTSRVRLLATASLQAMPMGRAFRGASRGARRSMGCANEGWVARFFAVPHSALGLACGATRPGSVLVSHVRRVGALLGFFHVPSRLRAAARWCSCRSG